MQGLVSSLPTVAPLSVDQIVTRAGASSGLWLVVLLPLSCMPGLYHTFAACVPSPKPLALLACQVGVSGVHIYRQMCGARRVEGPPSSPSLCVALVTHPFLPAIVTAAAMVLLVDLSPCSAIPLSFTCMHVMHQTTKWVLTTFPGSFTLGEGALLGQAAALATSCCLYSVAQAVLAPTRLTEVQQMYLFLETAFLVVACFVAGVYRYPLLRQAKMFLPFLTFCGVVGVGVSSLLLRQPSYLWLWEVVSGRADRQGLLAWWGGLTVLSMVLTAVAKRKLRVATTVLRKVYHGVIVLVFVPGVLLDPAFTHMAATAALLLCAILEFVRSQRIEPIASVVSEAFATFLDEKDGGTLILSHMYLLAGVAAPLWLNPCTLPSSVELPAPANSVLPLLAGVLAVGVGDTAASVGGTYLGKKRWKGTNKTVEGSLCGVAAQLVMVGVLVGMGVVDVSLGAWGRLVISTVIVGVVEALTDQVDNVVLPLLLYTPLRDL